MNINQNCLDKFSFKYIKKIVCVDTYRRCEGWMNGAWSGVCQIERHIFIMNYWNIKWWWNASRGEVSTSVYEWKLIVSLSEKSYEYPFFFRSPRVGVSLHIYPFFVCVINDDYFPRKFHAWLSHLVFKWGSFQFYTCVIITFQLSAVTQWHKHTVEKGERTKITKIYNVFKNVF